MDKLCVSKWYDIKLCVSKWCDEKLCVTGGGDEEATGGGGGGGGRDAEPKTRTPHKDVGNKYKFKRCDHVSLLSEFVDM